MKKILVIATIVLFLRIPAVFAQESIRVDITPQPCANRAGCPVDLIPAYDAAGEACVTDLNEFAAHPTSDHYWIEDPKITDQGKADDRARQFIYWTLTTRSLDDSPVLKQVWKLTSNITYFLVLFVAAMLGIGLIVGQRMRFETKVKIWPTVMKIVGILIYIAFSAAIIILLIQLSEILMKFFLETLGGKDFFNIYFSTDQFDQINQQGAAAGGAGAAATGSSETNYIHFVGCRDLNMRVQESVHAELFLFKATNITYYVMGCMILIRKILLWFLLFVAPFAAILIPFVFIRNVAWIWLGVFFQWLFYGPLFALFLGAIATIWKQGIPFLFDFSRTNKLIGYVYPTAINITYGGPAQHLGALNNGNYVDTFAEYIITLLMLWGAILFPWWLLRIFRDYCCDYLMAMKNILLNMYDQMRVSGGPLPPAPGPAPSKTRTTSTTQNIVNNNTYNQPTERRLETMQEIRSTTTQNILKSVNIAAPKLTDIANFETNKTVQQTAAKNIEYLRNPMKAETPAERQKYMNIRTELLNRALKEDKLAKQVLSSVSTSFVDQRENKSAISNQVYNAVSKAADNTQTIRENIAREVISSVSKQGMDEIVKQQNTSKESVIRTVLENTPAQRSIASVVAVPQQTINQVTNAITNSVSNLATITQIAQKSNVDNQSVQQIYQTYQQNSTQSPTQVFNAVANNQSISNSLLKSLSNNNNIVSQISSSTNVSTQDVQRITNEMSNVAMTPAEIKERMVVETVAHETNTQAEKVREVMSQIQTIQRENPSMTTNDVVAKVSTTTNVSTPVVQQIMSTVSQSANQSTSAIAERYVVDKISRETQTSQDKVREVIREVKAVERTEGTVPNQSIAAISTKTGVPASVVQNIITSWNQANQTTVSTSEITSQISERTNIQKEKVQSVIDHITSAKNEKVREVLNQIRDTAQQSQAAANIITQVSQTTKVEAPAVEQILQTWNQNIHQNPTQIINTITNNSVVSTALNNSIANNSQEVNSISNQTGVEGPNIQNIAQTWNKTITQSTTTAPGVSEKFIIEKASVENNISKEKVTEVLNQIRTHERERAIGATGAQGQAGATGATGLSGDIINNISNTTGVPAVTVQNIINTFNEAKAPAAPAEKMTDTQIIETISRETNIEKERVQSVMNQMTEMKKDKVRSVIKEVHDQISKDKTIVRQIAKQNNIKEEEVQKIAEAQKALVTKTETAPAIEKKIALPATVSIEDYEAVKKMWQKQYETGEIPVSENMQSREEWVDHDIVFITNALNKLMSEDETIRQQGLDDIGYILPIFMINNFKGEELLVYLKAKLEAAKQVQEQLEREQQLKDQLQQKDEGELVELGQKKAGEQEKTMQMQQSLTIDGDENKADQNPPMESEDGNGENGQNGPSNDNSGTENTPSPTDQSSGNGSPPPGNEQPPQQGQ